MPLENAQARHADLNPANVLLGNDDTAYVVDWTFIGLGAAFLDLALLIPWLLKAGHAPTEAELWASKFSDLFARVFATKWEANLATSDEAWALEHATAARQWASHRHAHTSAS